VLLAGVCACSGGADQGSQELFPEDSLRRMPPQSAYAVHVLLLDSLGAVRARVEADTAWAFPEQGRTVFRGNIRVYFYRADSLVGSLSADSARLEEATGIMAAFGHVRAVSYAEQRQLETTELFWERSRRQFFSSAPVRITTPTEEVEGVGFQASQDLQTYQVFQVRGRRR